jgi:hypothetical protein
MSYRVERLVIGQDGVLLRISGRIRAEDAGVLRDLLRREKGKVAIDLKDVLLVAREAVKVLAISEGNGTELRNCPAYIREWVDRERAHVDLKPSDVQTGASDDVENV